MLPPGPLRVAEEKYIIALSEMTPAAKAMDPEIKLAQSIAGEVLWCSGRTRPDIVYAVGWCCSLATIEPQGAQRIGEIS